MLDPHCVTVHFHMLHSMMCYVMWHWFCRHKSWDSTISIATGYRLSEHGVEVPSPDRVKNLHFCILSRLVLGPGQSHIQWILRALSLQLKLPMCEAHHSPRTSAKVKKTGIHTSTPSYGVIS